MKARYLGIAALGALALGACADRDYDTAEGYGPPPPSPPIERPLGPGAIAGTVAADRNGDGVVDGFYTQDGAYHPIGGACPPPPPPRPTRRGERG